MRDTKFSARFSREDQSLLVHIATCRQRTKSDTVRILIHEKAAELSLIPTPCSKQEHKGKRYH